MGRDDGLAPIAYIGDCFDCFDSFSISKALRLILWRIIWSEAGRIGRKQEWRTLG